MKTGVDLMPIELVAAGWDCDSNCADPYNVSAGESSYDKLWDFDTLDSTYSGLRYCEPQCEALDLH